MSVRADRPLIVVPGRRSPAADGLRTPVVAAGRLYVDAIQRAGGIAVVMPPDDDASSVRAAVERCDGMVLLGGGDVDPRNYGQQETARLHGVDPSLDEFEFTALRHALDLDMPVLAVCRGHQVLNVVMGGTLVQHLPTTDMHRDTMHDVTVAEGSRVATAMGTLVPSVHSFHHQAIDTPAPGLRVVATASDGTIEAVEHGTARWVVGVQWHPEDTAGSDHANQGLFAALVDAARR